MADPRPFPSNEEIAQLALGADVSTALRARAAEPAVAAEVARVAAIVATLKRDDGTDPDPSTVRGLLERLRRVRSVRDWFADLPRVVVEVVFDSRRQVGLAGFRGGLCGDGTTTIACSASVPHELHVDLQIERTVHFDGECEWVVRGLVEPVGEASRGRVIVGVVRRGDDSVEEETAAAADGRFALEIPAKGVWSVLIRTPECVARIDDIELS